MSQIQLPMPGSETDTVEQWPYMAGGAVYEIYE